MSSVEEVLTAIKASPIGQATVRVRSLQSRWRELEVHAVAKNSVIDLAGNCWDKFEVKTAKKIHVKKIQEFCEAFDVCCAKNPGGEWRFYTTRPWFRSNVWRGTGKRGPIPLDVMPTLSIAPADSLHMPKDWGKL